MTVPPPLVPPLPDHRFAPAPDRATCASCSGPAWRHPGFMATPPAPPVAVRNSTCRRCGGPTTWVDCPTGGWWAHRRHPADGHDAIAPAPPADPDTKYLHDDGEVY